MEKKSFILSIVALAVSIITLAVIFFQVTPHSVIDLGTFIGVMTALIGICITFLVGYQIYNAIEIQQKLAEIDRLKGELENANNNLTHLKSDVYEGVYSIAASTASKSLKDASNAFPNELIATSYTLDLVHSKDDCIRAIYDLEKYLLLVNHKTIKPEDIPVYIECCNLFIKDIKSHKNYSYIQDEFQRIIKAFYARMEKIIAGKEVSTDNVYADIE